MKKLLIGLLALSSISAFAEPLRCVSHATARNAQATMEWKMGRHDKETISVSDKSINGWPLAIEMNDNDKKENNIFPLTQIAKDGSYAFYGINDSYVNLCVKR
jgi:hypothetical protein